MAETVVSTHETRALNGIGYMGFTYHTETRPWTIFKACSATAYSIAFEEGKTSVVSGVFIPGEYRVNPYSVEGGRIEHSHNGRGAWYRLVPGSEDQWWDVESTFLTGAKLWPGIDTYADSKIAWNDPVYFVARPFTNLFTRDAYGYVKGGTYYQTAFVVGDWWRYKFAKQANSNVTPHVDSDYEQLALQKAYGKIGSGDLELGESIGELRETIMMLKSPLSALRKFLVDDKSRNWRLLTALAAGDKRQINRLLGRTGFATADAVSGTWLELRYGLRPLISLVQDVIDRVQSDAEEICDPKKIRSARSRLKFSQENWLWEQDDLGANIQIRSRVKVEDTYWASASVQYTQSEPTGFLDSLGLTPRFLPEVAWELTTLSFVVDWIFSIGPWLATLRINPDIQVLGNTAGFKHRRRVYLTATEICAPFAGAKIPWTGLPDVHDPVSGEDLMLETNAYDRKVDLDLSYLPHFTWGRTLDLWKALDSISLIWQFANKLIRS